MKELSIFVDESGDFGTFKPHSPFYLFTMVFHEQDKPITSQIENLDRHIREMGLPECHCFHAGPIIRREEDYSNFTIQQRRKCLNAITALARHSNITYKNFVVEKKKGQDPLELNKTLSKKLHEFLTENKIFFEAFRKIIVYYDNGQVELNKILASIFSISLANIEFRKVSPINYKLFQVADLLCTMKLIDIKFERGIQSASEQKFFGSTRDLKKNYLNPLSKLKFDE